MSRGCLVRLMVSYQPSETVDLEKWQTVVIEMYESTDLIEWTLVSESVKQDCRRVMAAACLRTLRKSAPAFVLGTDNNLSSCRGHQPG
jgi:hypothetical protein